MPKAFSNKPLRDHTLLLAMCRTNRLYDADDVQKQMGLIVDYLGVFENLRTALAYNPEEIEGVVEGIEVFKTLLPDQMKKNLYSNQSPTQPSPSCVSLHGVVYPG
ncbi:hypothetical protein A9G12_05945 [Gilliamella sp. wkB112]|nr:hypothetical protein [Gilliamella apicola]OCG05267.1 hypothetical protein A9G12_05945 [Gilliamella apicola]